MVSLGNCSPSFSRSLDRTGRAASQTDAKVTFFVAQVRLSLHFTRDPSPELPGGRRALGGDRQEKADGRKESEAHLLPHHHFRQLHDVADGGSIASCFCTGQSYKLCRPTDLYQG